MKNCESFLDSFDLKIPLCVDLDGTLIREDVTTLSVKSFLQKSPHLFWKVLIWICQGRAICKERLAGVTEIPLDTLTFNEALLKIIKREKIKGRPIVLATAADQKQAQAVEEYLTLFDHIIASNGRANRRAQEKADILTLLFQETGFLYAGNSTDDLHVWAAARGALCVNTPGKVLDKVPRLNVPYFTFSKKEATPFGEEASQPL